MKEKFDLDDMKISVSVFLDGGGTNFLKPLILLRKSCTTRGGTGVVNSGKSLIGGGKPCLTVYLAI